MCRSSVLPNSLNWDLILKLSWNKSWRIPTCLSIYNQSLHFFSVSYHLLYALEKVVLKKKAAYLWKDITIAGFHLAQKYYDFAIILNHLVQLAVAYLRWERSIKGVQSSDLPIPLCFVPCSNFSVEWQWFVLQHPVTCALVQIQLELSKRKTWMFVYQSRLSFFFFWHIWRHLRLKCS